MTPPWAAAPPHWQLSWGLLLGACPWLAPLAGTPQDPLHHAEGDVLTHTRMVAEALVATAGWRALESASRTALLVAALLHDVGKPQTTRPEPDGRITSRGHARLGAALARQILWEELGATLAERETVAGLVRLHGLPIWFLDRPDAERAILAASCRVRLDHLALLAEADARGRVSADQGELLARVDLFRAECADLGCLDRPFPFASDHSRVRYFRGAQRDPRYRAHDDTWGEVVVLGGLPGVGKDTWSREHGGGLPAIALDEIRRELRIAPTDGQGPVAAVARERARELLRRRQPFVWNATNLTRQTRDPLLDLLIGYGARVRLVYLDAPLDVVLARNARRAEPVPAGVIRRLAARAEPPDITEAHRVELVDARA